MSAATSPSGAGGAAGAQDRPRILLMGARRGGKSSIQRVVFHKMSPHETLFLESTNLLDIKFIANNAFVQFEVWDFPGDYEPDKPVSYGGRQIDADQVFRACGALVFVIDAQDDPTEVALTKLHDTVSRAHRANPDIHFEVFVHKVDGDLFLSDDLKVDCLRDVQQQVVDEMEDAGLPDVRFSFYLTSIYDHSIFEAFSKVVQKLVPQLPTMENLMNTLIASCNVEKAFLFDIVSKLYIATDSNPVHMQSYELCSDMIDVVIDVSCIYGNPGETGLVGDGPPAQNNNGQNNGSGGGGSGAAAAAGAGGADANGDAAAAASGGGGGGRSVQSSSVIRLSNGMCLYLREVDNYLALVCLLREQNFQKMGLIDYNIDCFKAALGEVFRVPRLAHCDSGTSLLGGSMGPAQ